MKNTKNKILILGLLIILVLSAVGLLTFEIIYNENVKQAERQQLIDMAIGATLLENNEVISMKNISYPDPTSNPVEETKEGYLLTNLLDEGEVFKVGKIYPEKISVKNSGSMPMYVRVTIEKSWGDIDGANLNLNTDLIELNILEGNGWIEDKTVTTSTKKVLYYTKVLQSGEVTTNVTDTFKVNQSVEDEIQETTNRDSNGNDTITTESKYDGTNVNIKVTTESIQEHNAEDAILAQWYRKVTIDSNGILSLQ